MERGSKRLLPAGDRAFLVWADDFRTVLSPLIERLRLTAAEAPTMQFECKLLPLE